MPNTLDTLRLPVLSARSPIARLDDYDEVYGPADPDAARAEGAACMNCGAAFCSVDGGYGAGCPIENKIPEWNELVELGRWRDAWDRLSLTNPFPEFTSRVCPAPCQDACIVGINDDPIQIKGIERAITDRAFAEGWVKPHTPPAQTGRHVAIVGSGPAGLAAADRLIRRGHAVTVFEKSADIGGLLHDGIPNMKLDKAVLARRVDLLRDSGVRLEAGRALGVDLHLRDLTRAYDAVLLAIGAQNPRLLDLPGAELPGVVRAMDHLTASTRNAIGATASAVQPAPTASPTSAQGHHCVVIGGGDTGADCIATALRQGARSVTNITRRQREPDARDARHPWPGPRGTYQLDYAHHEGAARHGRDPRDYGVTPLAFEGTPATGVTAVRIRRTHADPARPPEEHTLPATRVYLAIGFTGPEPAPLGGLILNADYTTSDPKIYTAGDCRRGASLVVWAIREGRDAADRIHADLRA